MATLFLIATPTHACISSLLAGPAAVAWQPPLPPAACSLIEILTLQYGLSLESVGSPPPDFQ